ncbi:protein kinase domain-containing protein [Winogradskya consettensis]|uniref:protein kinase domain-containing protein n=1 Tax=Winogradskya consettensis TaxID=113560 RepID=UPI001BB4506C|nr:protein kinase [Actinoplanes consettensis]
MSPLHSSDPEQLGEYVLTGRLGAGGMGVVYLAEDREGTYVAIKLVHSSLSHDPEFRNRFRSEVQRARQVPAFCTAEYLDADLDHEPPYLVVEYVDGPGLNEVVEERGPLRAAALHSLAVGVATALTGIHGAGVIHRDLKPDNVLLAPGSPKVIDFGLARAFEAATQHTRTDQMVGTVAYMAPERFSDDPGTPLTAAADIFAWGCVVCYSGTGRTPFAGDSPAATAGRILTQPPRLDGLPEPLRTIVERSLAKNPQDRPTARELLDALLAVPPAQQTPATIPTQRRPSEPTTSATPQPGTLPTPPPSAFVTPPPSDVVTPPPSDVVTPPSSDVVTPAPGALRTPSPTAFPTPSSSAFPTPPPGAFPTPASDAFATPPPGTSTTTPPQSFASPQPTAFAALPTSVFVLPPEQVTQGESRRSRVLLAALAVFLVVSGVATTMFALNAVDDGDDRQLASLPPVTSTAPSTTSAPVTVKTTKAPSPKGTQQSKAAASSPKATPASRKPSTVSAQANPSHRNLALNHPALASGSEGDPWNALYAVDGDTTTRWSSAFTDTQWLRVDLGNRWQISEVRVRWENAYAVAYRIEISTDSATWKSIYSTKTGTGGDVTIDVKDVPARYVRLYSTKRSSQYGISVYELEVR